MYCTRCKTSADAPHVCEVIAARPVATVPFDAPGGSPAPTPVLGRQAMALLRPSGFPPIPTSPTVRGPLTGSGEADAGFGPPAGAGWPQTGELSSPYGRLLVVIPRTRSWRGRFDVLVYERALVVAKVPGIDPATLGFVLSLPVGGIVGYVVGDRLGVGGNRQRTISLTASPPDQITGRHRRNRLVPLDGVRTGRIVSFGASGGRLKLRFHAGKALGLRWTRPHTRLLDVAGALDHAVGGVVPVRRAGAVRPYVGRAVAALVVMSIWASAVVAVSTGAETLAELRAARAEIAPVCRELLEADQRNGSGDLPTDEQLAILFTAMDGPFALAAQRSPELRPANAAVGRVRRHLVASPEQAAGSDPAELHGDYATVVGACRAAHAAHPA